MNENVITVEDITFAYNRIPVLEDVSFDVQRGEFLGLVGPNGGGKSTLLKIILGLLKPRKGRVSVLGKTPEKGRRSIGYVPQHTSFKREFPITVEETVLLGLLGKTRPWFGYSAAELALAQQAMEEAQILDLKARQLGTLSGGQFQRVLIARSLIADPEILILDEPTANIDLRVEENIFDLLKQLNRRATIIVVSHDVGFISEYVTRVACLNKTLVCHETSAISGQIIEKIYGEPVHMIKHIH
jgi:zinc transport system ATP-binding protein